MSDPQQTGSFDPGASAAASADSPAPAALAKTFAQPHSGRSSRQLLITLAAFAGLWLAMLLTVNVSYWITLALALPTAGFLVRLFIIQHDCGHRSFFRSRWLNDLIGQLIGIITLTPHAYWRQAHNIHHATCGNLEKRGIGDVHTLTVAEYAALPVLNRIAYRIYRNPLVLFLFGPTYLFGLKFRLPLDLIRRRPKLLANVMVTNVAIIGVLTGLGLGFGFLEILLIQAPINMLAATAGVWLFYVQHQFEQTHWRHDHDWRFHDAAILSSSYYVLPQPLRWLSADIGIHHVHHLNSRIPNYRLKDCLDRIPALQQVNRLRLLDSIRCLPLALWDEASQRMISFRTFARAKRAALRG